MSPWQTPESAAWYIIILRWQQTLHSRGDYPAVSNVTRSDQRIRLFRFNEVNLAGGLTGSRFRIKIRQSVEPVTVQ
jgi:hypothetical protein